MHRSRTTRTLRVSLAAIVLAATGLLGGMGSGPASALDLDGVMPVVGVIEGPNATVIGYTLGADQAQTNCELLTIDWSTGFTTDLPAAPSPDACVVDLAVAPDGTVHGLGSVPSQPQPTTSGPSALATCAATSQFCGNPLARFVTFAPDGTATSIEIGTSNFYLMDENPLALFRGLAIDSVGTIFVLLSGLMVDVRNCQPALAPGSASETSVMDGQEDWSSCLFTLDPGTGVLTLVGPSRLPATLTAGLSIGVDGAWTLSLPGFGVGSTDPAAFVDFYWSRVNLLTGEVTPSGAAYSSSNGFFDQLRSSSGILALVGGPTSGYDTGDVDPSNGQITPIIDLNTRRPEPVTPTYTG